MPIKFDNKKKSTADKILDYLSTIKSPDEGAPFIEIAEKLSIQNQRVSEIVKSHPILKRCIVPLYNSKYRYVLINPKFLK